MNWPEPTAEEQLQFLRNIQRLLAEGQFVATYKFALIHALADLAVLKGQDSGEPLDLDTAEIATKFVELYWPQCRPFQAPEGTSGIVLRQNTGSQAEIISKIVRAQQMHGASLFRFKQRGPGRWRALNANVARVVRKMPLWKLQTVGYERLDFLYADLGHPTQITLKPGIAYCFRAYYQLIRDLIEGAWVRFVQKVNASELGNTTDLGTFLFGQERANLDAYRRILMDVQRGICMYCGKNLRRHAQVDHFIPWSRYPADLGHNFVLAHSGCNNAKSDHVAAEKHLDAWAERNRQHQAEFHTRLQDGGLPSDMPAAIEVAKWVYQQTERANGQVWVKKNELQRLGPTWAQLLHP
jgi:hypothetical protein